MQSVQTKRNETKRSKTEMVTITIIIIINLIFANIFLIFAFNSSSSLMCIVFGY